MSDLEANDTVGRALDALEAGNYEQALRLADAALSSASHHTVRSEALSVRGEARARTGRAAEAREDLQAAVSAHREHAPTWERLATVLDELDEPTAALEARDECLRVLRAVMGDSAPRVFQKLGDRGLSHVYAGNRDAAEADFRAAVEGLQSSGREPLWLAEALDRLGLFLVRERQDPAGALDCFDRRDALRKKASVNVAGLAVLDGFPKRVAAQFAASREEATAAASETPRNRWKRSAAIAAAATPSPAPDQLRIPTEPLSHHFYTMACNNGWANTRLLESCKVLGDDGFTAPRESFFGSLAATANHIALVDYFYIDALERSVAGKEPHANPSVFFSPDRSHATLDSVAGVQRCLDTDLIVLTASFNDAQLMGEVRIHRKHGTSVDSVSAILAHLFQHQIHHRGQIHGMLSAAGVRPPQLDEFFCRADAPARQGWLKSVGLKERDLRRS